MKALFVHDTFYMRDRQGAVYALGAFPSRLWQDRFLPHFDQLEIIAREGKYNAHTATGADRSDCPGVDFTLLPNINTPFRRIFAARDVYKHIFRKVAEAEAVIIRGPVEFGMMAAKAARKLGTPYAVEMSGCAFDHSWYHGSLAGKLYAPLKYLRARQMVKHADHVIYVTKDFLQRRYPTNGETENASNVEIERQAPEIIERRLERIDRQKGELKFGMIGNFGNNLKGLGIALNALGRISDGIPAFELRLLGQGRYEDWAPAIEKAGLENLVHFDGLKEGGQAVLEWLDDIDIYMQPSFHEGLPRALIEAMSRGCPALASDAGGTDELLDNDFIHKRGQSDALAKHIIKMVGDRNERRKQAQANFKVAQRYVRDILKQRRYAFWAAFAAYAARMAEKEQHTK